MGCLRRAAIGLSLVGLVGGWSLQARAYGIKTTENGAMVHWTEDAVGMRLDPSIDNQYGHVDVRGAFQRAVEAWHGLPGVPEVLLNDGEPGPQGFESVETASNGVYVVPTWELNPEVLAVTVATYDTADGRSVDADILINPNKPQTLLLEDPMADPEAQYDLQSVMTHEVGHVLGLDESYDHPEATMFPDVMVGDTFQRDIAADDVEGVAAIYGQQLVQERAAELEEALKNPLGCGSASVTGKTPRQGLAVWWLVAGALTTLLLAARRNGARRVLRRAAPVLGVTVLFGAPLDPAALLRSGTGDVQGRVRAVRALVEQPAASRAVALRRAIESDEAAVRRAAAEVLAEVGRREDMALAAVLAGDRDPAVAHAGALAQRALRTAPPAARVAASDPDALRRLSALLDGASGLYTGRATRLGATRRGALIWTRYAIEDGDERVEVEIPGGQLGRFAQTVSELTLPPEGARLTVALREGGAAGWAYARDGLLYGGWLGQGPAIEWAD